MKDPSSAFRCTVGVFGLSLIQSREHPELYGEAHRLESFLKSPCSCAGAGARHYRIIGTALGGWGRRVHPEAVQLENSQQGWIVPQLGPPEVPVTNLQGDPTRRVFQRRAGTWLTQRPTRV
jgi:hypothetical protein